MSRLGNAAYWLLLGFIAPGALIAAVVCLSLMGRNFANDTADCKYTNTCATFSRGFEGMFR